MKCYNFKNPKTTSLAENHLHERKRLRRSRISVTSLRLISNRLRRSRTLILAYLLCPLWMFAQRSTPGGVPTPKIWYTSELTSTGEILWKDRLTGQIEDRQPGSADHLLNFNPAFTFDRNHPGLALSVPELKPEKWTLFTTYHPSDTFTEKSIWSYGQAGITEGILTTHRMADLQQFEYLNFPGKQSPFPQVSTYLHHRGKKAASPSPAMKFRLAQKPRDRSLPISSFRGKIPEIILYERVLSPEERQRVESYLAIKYGTNLAPEQELDYLNAKGQVIFSPSGSGDFRHRITGIGRDDLSGLYQKQSTSSYAPGLLTLGLREMAGDHSSNTRTLPDQHFLLWADNNQALDLADKKPLLANALQRQWLMQATGDWTNETVQVAFDTHQLPTPAAPTATYWLVIDRTARGNFSGIESVDYYPLDHLQADGKAHFQPVRWDTDGSGRDIFTIATGPELLVQAELSAPSCFPETNGRLRLKAIGGRAPYQFQLRRDKRLISEWTNEQDRIREIPDLPPGTYELLLSDADNKHFRETFYFQSADAPEIPVKARYQLAEDQALNIDVTINTNANLQYEWQLPDGSTHHLPDLNITQAGEYTLRVDQNGCIAQRTISVEPAPRGNFRRVQLFPNPSSDGHFQARIHLEKAEDLQLTVYDPGGRLLFQRKHAGSDYYHTGAQLSGKGTYLIQFRSQNDQITIPLIVQ